MPINLVLAWELRDHCVFVVADLSEKLSEEMSLLFKQCEPATVEGVLKHFRRLVPEEDGFTHWHASIGAKRILVGLDKDNFISKTFRKAARSSSMET